MPAERRSRTDKARIGRAAGYALAIVREYRHKRRNTPPRFCIYWMQKRRRGICGQRVKAMPAWRLLWLWKPAHWPQKTGETAVLNYIWAFMIGVGILYGAFTGNIEAVSDAALDSAKEAVDLCITMIGIMGLWVGLMEIAQKSGLIARMTKGIQPFISFMFPRLPKGHIAREYISANIIANIMGLGWAATPAGLKAMEALAQLERERGNPEYLACDSTPPKKACIASKEMCTFLILNISSLQLIPVNMIAYRSQYGSVNPTAIVGPAIVATAVSTGAAVIFCKMMDRRR